MSYNVLTLSMICDLLPSCKGKLHGLGSGKSYSMVGYGQNKGIVPISCEEIFQRISSDRKSSYEVLVSAIEIYNEAVQELKAISFYSSYSQKRLQTVLLSHKALRKLYLASVSCVGPADPCGTPAPEGLRDPGVQDLRHLHRWHYQEVGTWLEMLRSVCREVKMTCLKAFLAQRASTRPVESYRAIHDTFEEATTHRTMGSTLMCRGSCRKVYLFL